MISFDDISAAAERIKGKVLRTPTISSHALSKATGADITLKLENLQAVGSFKERGAANKLALLSPEERQRGVIAVSAGNHAQGVARHASLLGIDAVIVMPKFTPAGKVVRTRNWGARVILEGESFAEALMFAQDLQAREGQFVIRRSALVLGIPHYTTVAGARAAIHAIAAMREGPLDVAPLQSYFSGTF